MSKNTELLIEIMTVLVLVVALSFVPSPTTTLGLFTMVIPLWWYSFRRGVLPTVILALICSVVVVTAHGEWSSDIVSLLLVVFLLLISGAIPGFFSKFTIRTLFNRKTTSTILNVMTGTFLSSLLISIIAGLATSNADLANTLQHTLNVVATSWGSVFLGTLFTWLIGVIIFVVMIKWWPTGLIPRFTRHLSRRERSSLLND